MASEDNRAAVVPPAVVGSPVDLAREREGAVRPADAVMYGDVPWWHPSWMDVIRALGWRWLILAPAIAVGAGFPLYWLFGHSRIFHMVGPASFKLVITAWAVIISLLLWGRRNVIRARKDPFCIHCGYSLIGLMEETTCPECGRPFTAAIIEEFRKDPHFFMERHKAARQHPPATPFAAGAGPTPDDGTGS